MDVITPEEIERLKRDVESAASNTRLASGVDPVVGARLDELEAVNIQSPEIFNATYNPPPLSFDFSSSSPSEDPHPFDLQVVSQDEDKITYKVLNPKFCLQSLDSSGAPFTETIEAEVPLEGFTNPSSLSLTLHYSKEEKKDSNGKTTTTYKYECATVDEYPTTRYDHRTEIPLYDFTETYRVRLDYRHAFVALTKDLNATPDSNVSVYDPDKNPAYLPLAGNIVGISMDYISSPSDPDFDEYPYAIRHKRGRLTILDNGQLAVWYDDKLTEYIKTTPLSKELKYFAEVDYGTPNME